MSYKEQRIVCMMSFFFKNTHPCLERAAYFSIYIYIFLAVLVFAPHSGFLQVLLFTAGCGASHCRGFSCCGPRARGHGPSSCGARAQLLCGMWDLPQPRMEPVSPALAGGFSTTGPQGKSMTSLNRQHEIIQLTTGRTVFTQEYGGFIYKKNRREVEYTQLSDSCCRKNLQKFLSIPWTSKLWNSVLRKWETIGIIIYS